MILHYYLPFTSLYQTQFLSKPINPPPIPSCSPSKLCTRRRSRLSIKGCSSSHAHGEGGDRKTERKSFLTLEEAGLVEISGLSTHEKFLCRLTISSLNLLRVISEQEGCSIEELNAGRVCDWFVKDKLKREQDIDSAVLKWDESEFPI